MGNEFKHLNKILCGFCPNDITKIVDDKGEFKFKLQTVETKNNIMGGKTRYVEQHNFCSEQCRDDAHSGLE